jgi:ABC-type nitrate/sulfonate/bicarbonate transport system permease component
VSGAVPAEPTTTIPPAPRAGGRLRGLGQRLAYSSGLLVVLVLIWQLVTAANPDPFFPTPLTIAEFSADLFFGGPAGSLFLTDALTSDTFQTVVRIAVGFVLGSLAGVVIGTAIGLSQATREVTSPVVEFLRSIPATATLPLFVVLFGGDDGMRVAFIAYGVTWFVLINTASGVSSIHPTQLAMGRAFRLSRRRQLTGIVLPAALPKIFAGLRVANTAALLLAIVSEFVLATNGIGFRLIQAQNRFQLVEMWSWMVLLAVLGLLLNLLLEAIEHRVLAWHRLART